MLRIFLFGRARVNNDDRTIPINIPRTGQVLLTYLLLHHQRSYSREMLAGLFWADHPEERARSCLSTALWRLRSALELPDVSDNVNLITTSTTEIGINQESNYWLDVAIFETSIGQLLDQPIPTVSSAAVHMLEESLRLYTGELLEGFYDDWVLRERERLRDLYLRGLTYLMRYFHHHRAYEQSLVYGHQVLQEDPLREKIHREVMRIYLENEQPALAVRQYQTCCKILETELDIAPMPETQNLYNQIVSASKAIRSQPLSPSELASLQQALYQLRQARQNFEEAQQKLQQAIQLVEQLSAT